MKAELKKLEKSQVEIAFELDEKEFATYVDRALNHLKSHVKMDGFRPGTVPKDIIEKKIGNENILMEAGNLAVKEIYARYVRENALEPIGEPEVQIKKIAKGSEMVFSVIVAVLPDIDLPDYRAIAVSVKAQGIAVDEKEVEDALSYLQRSRAVFTDKTEGAQKKDYIKIEYQNENINGGKPVRDIFILGEGGFLKDFEANLEGMKVGEEKEFKAQFPEKTPGKIAGKEGVFKVKMLAVQIMELPQLNDEFAKSLGAFDTLVSLKENIKEGITLEKQEGEKQRKRGEILEKIAAKTQFEIPEKMVAYEQERLFEDLQNQVSQNFRISFEEYLASVKKTEQEVKQSFALEARKRLKDFLVLRQIGRQESVEVSSQEIEDEANKVLKKYSKEQAEKIDIHQLKEYSEGVIFNEKVFQLLEAFSRGISK